MGILELPGSTWFVSHVRCSSGQNIGGKIITNAKMFLKVFFRVFQIVLRLGRDHILTLANDTFTGCQPQ
jgi:hypothetical protein